MSDKDISNDDIDGGASDTSSPSNKSDQQPAAKKQKVEESSDKESEDLEEGELPDDDDDDDDEEDNENQAQNSALNKRSTNDNNNNNNNNINNNNNFNNSSNIINESSNYHRESSYGESSGPNNNRHGGGPPSHIQQQYHQQHLHAHNHGHSHPHQHQHPHPHQHPHQQLPHIHQQPIHPGYQGPPHHNMQPAIMGQALPHPYMMHRRQMSPNSHTSPDMMHAGQYPPSYHYDNNSHFNNSRFPPNEGPPMPMAYHPAGGPINMYPRGPPPGGVGPPQKNVRCRFYSKHGNKCTWGDSCRFAHLDDSPEPVGPGEPYPEQRPPAASVPRQVSPGGSSSSAHYERKQRLAYELAPWNEGRSGYALHSGSANGRYGERVPGESSSPMSGAAAGPPLPMSRGPPGAYHSRHSHYNRLSSDHPAAYAGGPPYHHYPPYHPSSGYPSAYRGSPMGGLHHSHSSLPSKYSSQRTNVPPEVARRSRSSKMGHDEDESSWSDSGSDDSILVQSNKYHHNHHNHHHHSGGKGSAGLDCTVTGAGSSSSSTSKRPKSDPLMPASTDQELPDLGGSGTPPGEPSPEDRDRQEMLLNKLKEIEDAMAKKKSEQEDGATK